MTQDHSALLAQLDALKSADVGAVFAELIRAGLQALIEAEATETIGAGRYEHAPIVARTATGTDPKRCPPPPATSRCRSPSCGRIVLPVAAGAASPHRSSAARGDHGGLRARESRPAVSMTWWPRWASVRGIQIGGLADLCRPG